CRGSSSPSGTGKGVAGNEQVRSTVVTAEPAAAGYTASVLTIILHAHPAVLADSAAPRIVDDHGVSWREPRRTGPKLFDPSRVLMTKCEGELDRPLGRGSLHEVEIGVTGARTADFYKDLTRSGLGHRHLA